MVEHREGTLAAFFSRLRRSPVRWVVLVHALLLLSVIALRSATPAGSVFVWLDASLVIAQVALLLIWTTLDGRGTARRTVGVAFVVAAIQIAHAPGPQIARAIPGLICFVPALFIFLTIVALPLSFAQSMGMQLLRFDVDNLPPPRRMQFSIRAALLASVVVAVLFGLKGIPEALDRQPGASGHEVAFALAVVVMILVGSAIYLSIPVVAVWAVLTPGKILPRMATAVVGWALGGLLVFHYTNVGQQGLRSGIPAGVTAGGVLILLATLLVLRAMRYRIVWDMGNAGNPFQPASPFDDVTDHSNLRAPP